MARTNVTWTECMIVGVLVFGVVGTSALLALLGGFIAYIRTDTDFWRDLDNWAMFNAVTPSRTWTTEKPSSFSSSDRTSANAVWSSTIIARRIM